MPNSIDFRADQIQTKQIIVTGSGAGTTKLLIYGIEAQGSPVNEGEINQTVFPSDTAIGGDVFLYVSGALNTKGSATKRGTSVFGGDLVVSGSLYNGLVTVSGGFYSHAEGNSTIASGNFSHAEGNSTIASGGYSHAEGEESESVGFYSHAEGRSTIASGSYSHAEGNSTIASGGYSHAEGNSTIASGSYSHAEGYLTVAFGTGSHASGNGTIASGSVDGAALSATSILQTATGRFNTRGNTTSLFVVGNGTGDSDALRGDIFRAESTGILVLSGGIRHKTSFITATSPGLQHLSVKTDYLNVIYTAGFDCAVILPETMVVGTDSGHTITIRQHDAVSSAATLTISGSLVSAATTQINHAGGWSDYIVLNSAGALTGSNRSVTLTWVSGQISPGNPGWFVTSVY